MTFYGGLECRRNNGCVLAKSKTMVAGSRRRGANAPRRCAWKRRTMEAGRIARFWFRNTISVPGEPTFQREDQRFDLPQVTHLRFTIVPNKSGSGPATLTTLRLFA
jgi:hypothetical protein